MNVNLIAYFLQLNEDVLLYLYCSYFKCNLLNIVELKSAFRPTLVGLEYIFICKFIITYIVFEIW